MLGPRRGYRPSGDKLEMLQPGLGGWFLEKPVWSEGPVVAGFGSVDDQGPCAGARRAGGCKSAHPGCKPPVDEVTHAP